MVLKNVWTATHIHNFFPHRKGAVHTQNVVTFKKVVLVSSFLGMRKCKIAISEYIISPKGTSQDSLIKINFRQNKKFSYITTKA